MSGTADANLIIAAINEQDALHARAQAHLARHAELLVPFSVGIELLFVARKHGRQYLELIEMANERFEVEGIGVLRTAAEALDTGEVTTVFDAVHLADALHRHGALHTADQVLHRSAFPTEPF